MIEDIWRDDGTVATKCQCNVRSPQMGEEIETMKRLGNWEQMSERSREVILREYERSGCDSPADPASGEAFLCDMCMNEHKQENMIPKRLPKRSLV